MVVSEAGAVGRAGGSVGVAGAGGSTGGTGTGGFAGVGVPETGGSAGGTGTGGFAGGSKSGDMGEDGPPACQIGTMWDLACVVGWGRFTGIAKVCVPNRAKHTTASTKALVRRSHTVFICATSERYRAPNNRGVEARGQVIFWSDRMSMRLQLMSRMSRESHDIFNVMLMFRAVRSVFGESAEAR